MAVSMEILALPEAAANVRRRLDEANAAQDLANWFGMSPECVAAFRKMQDAYVAYCAAFGRAYPAEAHLLPDCLKGRLLPEYGDWQVASAAYDKAIYDDAMRRGRSMAGVAQ